MLVLSRKDGEVVRLGCDIEVKVLAIRGNAVKLGFSAPPEVNIRRKELSSQTKQRKCYEKGAIACAVVDATLVPC